MDHAQMRTWAEISLPNLEHNYHALRRCIPYGCKFVGLVKANAYGHGAVEIAKKLEELGADYLAVACMDEAADLRNAGITMPILSLGATPAAAMPWAVELCVTQTVFDMDGAKALSDAAMSAGTTAKVHIKLDTGMSRLGFPAREEEQARSAEEIREICALPGLDAEGIFTHFANADGDEDYTMLQFTRFLDMLKRLEELGVRFPIRHCAASAATLNYPCTHMDMVRPGIALYGHYPDPSCEGMVEDGLKPVMTVKTRVVFVKHLPKGTAISYGCTHVLQRDSVIATLPIGYGDGFFRLLSNKYGMLLHGRRAPIVGRVCMDMCMVDVTDIPGVQPGDEAEVFGENNPIETAADLVGTIQYELLCDVNPRVHRVYLR